MILKYDNIIIKSKQFFYFNLKYKKFVLIIDQNFLFKYNT